MRRLNESLTLIQFKERVKGLYHMNRGEMKLNKYQLIKKTMSNRNQFKVTIVADANDGDYITTINTYTKEWFEEDIVEGLIDLQENFSGDNELQEYDNDWIDIPHDGQEGCHSLESIDIEYIDENGEVWDVELT